MNLSNQSIDIAVGRDERRRAVRVVTLCIAVFLLGLGDLYNTIVHMNNFGMVELNPLARHMVEAKAELPLILFKLGSLGIAIGLFLRVRYHRSAEYGAWVMAAVMVALTWHWHMYNDVMQVTLASMEADDVTRYIGAFADASG